MESNDSYPVFHTRLVWTRRRRFTNPDGTPGGWLIINAADQLTELTRPDTDDDGGDASCRSVPHQR